MTNIEITKLCAEAMGFNNVHIAHGCLGTPYVKHTSRSITANTEFRPLHDDAQAMALVKKFRLSIDGGYDGGALLDSEKVWVVEHNDSEVATISRSPDINRAICECVAKVKELSVVSQFQSNTRDRPG